MSADRPSVTDNARAERPLRCDGTPHPEGAIPPLSEHDYRWDGDDPYVVCARCGERRDALTASRVLDYHRRAETTTATLMARRGGKTQALIESLLAQAEDRGLTVEVVYPEMTTATTATTEDAARVIDDACYGGASSPQEIAQALADAGLLATARTRPTRTIYSVQHWEDADGIRASWVTGYGQYTHSHEDAEATLRHQERQHPDTTFRLAQAEVTAWTETGQ